MSPLPKLLLCSTFYRHTLVLSIAFNVIFRNRYYFSQTKHFFDFFLFLFSPFTLKSYQNKFCCYSGKNIFLDENSVSLYNNFIVKITEKLGIRIAIIVTGGLIAFCLLYFLYFVVFSYRQKDNLKLKAKGQSTEEELETNLAYRLISHNIGFGAYSPDFTFFMDGGKESRAFSRDQVIGNTTGCARVTSNMGADFLLYQEVDIRGTRSHFVNEADLLVSIIEENDTINWVFAQNYNSPYILYPLSSPHGRNKSGIMTASHFKIQDATRRSLPVEKGLSRLVDLDRCYAKTVFNTKNSKKFIIYNVHLSAYTTTPETGNNQIRMICMDMDEEYRKGNYVLAAGDMNREIFERASELFGKTRKDYSWCQSFPEKLLPENLNLVPPCSKEAPVPTSRNTDIPYGPDNFVTIIDGFIVSKNIMVLTTEVLKTDFEYSDHNPIYIDFMLSDDNK